MDALVAAEQIAQLFTKPFVPYLAPSVVSILYASVVWTMVPHWRLGLWMAAMFTTTALRLVVRLLGGRAHPGILEARRWGYYSMLIGAFQCLVWAVGLIWVYTPESLGAQMLYAFIVAGVTAGAIGVNAGHLPTYFALTSALVLVAVRFFVYPDWIHHVMAICVLIYFVAMGIVAATSNHTMREATRLRFRLASANDALARRADEQEQFAERLRRAEERLRLAVDAGRLGVWYVDLPLRTLDCSPGIKKYLGIPPDAEVTAEMYWASIHPQDRERVRAAVDRAVREGTDFDVEYRNVGIDGGIRSWVRAIGKCFLHDGKPYHFDGIIQDISREKQEKEERERLLHELSEANRLRERLLGIVGHDLKTPVGAIAMAGNLLQRQVVDHAATKNVDRILRSAERIKRLIGQLLDFARIRATGTIPVEIAPADLHGLCRHVIDELATAHPRAAISLEAIGDSRGVWDSDRLAQVLSNLLGNAIQHGGGGSISVRVLDEEENVVVTVHNPGPPIPPDVLPFIFDPFRQGDRRYDSHAQSVGLGLYIVQQIVVAHGGQIYVRSPDGDGTTFTVRLPRHPEVRAASGGRTVTPFIEGEGPTDSTTLH